MHGAPVTVEDTIVGMLDAAAQDVNVKLAEATRKLEGDPEARGPEFMRNRQAELASQLERIREKVTNQANPLILSANDSAYKAGLATSEKQLRAMGIKEASDTVGGISFNLVNERTIEAIARDTAARVNSATGTHIDNARKLFHSFSEGPLSGIAGETATNNILVRGIISGDPVQATRELRELIGENIGVEAGEGYRKVGNKIIEVGNAKMSIRHYATTVIRTRTREATTQAQMNRQLSVGLDLAQITGLRSENFCSDYLGMVVVLRGPGRDGYLEIAEIGGPPPFHPNCSKVLSAFHPDLVSAERVERAKSAAEHFERLRTENARKAA